MHLRIRDVFWPVAVLLVAGCASISIDEPPVTGLVAARPPIAVKVTPKGFVDFGDPLLDNFNLSRYNGQNFQYVPQSTLYYVTPGTHTLGVPAKDGKWHTDISQARTFSVTACPLCYSCPVGNVHPVTGQCCDNGMCDKSVFGNFGPGFYNSMNCQKMTFPSTNPRYWNEFDCISTAFDLVRGAAAGARQMLAVSFTPVYSGALRHVQAPIGLRSGTNSLLVWVTADANNAPGQVLESLTMNTVRAQPVLTSSVPAVDAPAHIFFNGTTQLTAGTRYWLVLGPGAANTDIAWNLSLDDFSIPATTNYLVNTTNSSVAGPWTRKTPNLADLRPAFEVDVR
jgi:hypothetical protein